MSGSSSKKTRCSGSYWRPPKAVPPELEGFYVTIRRIVSWLVLRLPSGSLRKAEEERIERATNWGRW